jgi:hypothetical protein
MERRTGKKIKIVRTDGGTEFLGEFQAYLKSVGISQQYYPPHRHSHPGKAERANQTILQNERAMLIASKLPADFYVDAQLMSAYIYNRVVYGTDTITLFEHIFGSKPKLDRLYPFGCVCYGHVPKESRKKLDPTGIECRLIGYGDQDESTQMKGFKLLEIATNKIHFLRDFVFDTVTEPNQFADYEYLKPNDPEFFHDSR